MKNHDFSADFREEKESAGNSKMMLTALAIAAMGATQVTACVPGQNKTSEEVTVAPVTTVEKEENANQKTFPITREDGKKSASAYVDELKEHCASLAGQNDQHGFIRPYVMKVKDGVLEILADMCTDNGAMEVPAFKNVKTKDGFIAYVPSDDGKCYRIPYTNKPKDASETHDTLATAEGIDRLVATDKNGNRVSYDGNSVLSARGQKTDCPKAGNGGRGQPTTLAINTTSSADAKRAEEAAKRAEETEKRVQQYAEARMQEMAKLRDEAVRAVQRNEAYTNPEKK